MIELGAVAYRNGVEVSHFYGALHEVEGLGSSEGTMQFWRSRLKRWKEMRGAAEDPAKVMNRFYNWAIELPQPRTLAANPSPFDCAFLFWYLNEFCGEDAVNDLFKRHRALDIRTMISVLYDVPFSDAERRLVPSELSEGLYTTHNALEDAREQGTMLVNLLKMFPND